VDDEDSLSLLWSTRISNVSFEAVPQVSIETSVKTKMTVLVHILAFEYVSNGT
jgi:hypothetical protein